MIARLRRTHAAASIGGATVVLLAVLLTLGCAGTETTSTTQAATASTTAPTSQPTTDSTAEPAAEFSVDDITAEYVYTSELVTILYPLYGSMLDDFVTVTLTNNGSLPAKIVVKSEIVGYTDPAINTVEVPAGETLDIGQNPLLKPAIIDDLNVQKPAKVHIQVAALQEGIERTILDETADTLVYARRDFPLTIKGFSDAEVLEFWAAMVTPNDPSVEELLRKAADYTDSGIIWSGYGDNVGDDDGGVWDRLEAVWDAQTDHDLVYVSTWVSFAPGAVQRIRLPAEVLEQRSGNCIELAMLYAAAAEAMDLEAALIMIPGHAFVGIRTDEDGGDYYFIETTMIGHASFSDAVTRAGEEFDEALPHIEAGELGYGWVNIWEARDKGILPLAWR